MTLDVKVGEILLNHVAKLVDTSHAKVFSVDCGSKYAAIYSAHGDEDIEVMLIADERTLRKDESKKGKPTVLTFTHPKGERWDATYDCARYTATIVFHRWDETIATTEWDSED